MSSARSSLAKFGYPCLTLGLMAALGGCPGPNDVVTYILVYGQPTIAAGQTTSFTASINGTGDAAGFTIHWTSSNEAIATVSSPGFNENAQVTGVAPGGPVTITATAGGQSGFYQTTVTACSAAPALVQAAGGPKATCSALTTWKLDSIRGTPTVTGSNDGGTATGTLALTAPQTVTEGDSVAVSATYSGTWTASASFSGVLAVSMTVNVYDSPFNGTGETTLSKGALKDLGKPAPSVTSSVSVPAKWYIPPINHNQTKLILQANGSFISAIPGTFASLIAYYSKQ